MAPRRSSRTKWAFALAAFVLFIAWLALYFDSLHQCHRAERLFSDLKKFPFATADYSQVRDFVHQHGGHAIGIDLANAQSGCTPRDCDFEVWVRPLVAKLSDDERLTRFTLAAQRYMGIRPWGVMTSFEVRDGKLQHSRTGVAADSRTQLNDLSIEYVVETDRASTPFVGAFPRSEYLVYRPHITGPPADALYVTALQTPRAPWKRAFDVHLDCLTTITKGCADIHQLAPLSWADREAMNKKLDEALLGGRQGLTKPHQSTSTATVSAAFIPVTNPELELCMDDTRSRTEWFNHPVARFSGDEINLNGQPCTKQELQEWAAKHYKHSVEPTLWAQITPDGVKSAESSLAPLFRIRPDFVVRRVEFGFNCPKIRR